jgi:hypothetical protein
MIPIRTLSLLVYFTYTFIDIIIYALGSMPWSSEIFQMVGRVVADPSLGLPSLCGVVPRVPILINYKFVPAKICGDFWCVDHVSLLMALF